MLTRLLKTLQASGHRSLMAFGPLLLLVVCLSLVGSTLTMDGSILCTDITMELNAEADADPTEKSEQELDADDEKLQHAVAALQWLTPMAVLRWHHPNLVAAVPLNVPPTPPPERG